MLAAHFKYLISDHRLPLVSSQCCHHDSWANPSHCPGGKFLLPFENENYIRIGNAGYLVRTKVIKMYLDLRGANIYGNISMSEFWGEVAS